MRLVLGTRHNVTGRYDDAGQTIRFEGTWRRVGSELIMEFSGQPGMPQQIVLAISKEEELSEIPCGRFCQRPENAPPLFTRQNILRLRGTAVVAGSQVELDLRRIITDVTAGGGGPTQT